MDAYSKMILYNSLPLKDGMVTILFHDSSF